MSRPDGSVPVETSFEQPLPFHAGKVVKRGDQCFPEQRCGTVGVGLGAALRFRDDLVSDAGRNDIVSSELEALGELGRA
jgi:hypothetical protein